MRKNDWVEQLENTVSAARVIPFTWGVHDCVTFVARCIDQMCGTAHCLRMREEFPYSTEEGAYAVIAENGGWVGLISKFLGPPAANPLFAAPGDAVLVDRDGREALGIVVGHNIVVASDEGVSVLPYKNIKVAWRV